MGAQVLKLLVPHGHELLKVAQIGPLFQPGRANTCRLEALQPRFRDAVLSDQLDAVVKLRSDNIDELLGGELITTHDAPQAHFNLLELIQHLFSAGVSRL
ncbi:hypothetical protein O999_23080 [Pseudomonas putida LF54]|nr:hypothetical protein O999_23080 [Pseudomonas putida LF54]